MELVVATWNLQGRSPLDAGMRDVLAVYRPDILLLQEADPEKIEHESPLAEYEHRVLRPDAGYPPGMAILSRLPVVASGALTLNSAPESPRLAWARLRTPDSSEVLAATFHVAAPIGDPRTDHPWARAIHLAAVTAFAASIGQARTPAILGGDCNTVRYHIEGFRDAAAAASRPLRTWRPIGGVRRLPAVARLDRIFVSPEWALLSVETACGMSRSDHCPVVARMRLAPA